jgi:hypothetical protein
MPSYANVTDKVSNNHWNTNGSNVSCECKKYLYIMSKTTNCSEIKVYYIQYCRVLRKVITKAKEMYCNECYHCLQINLKRLGTLLIMIFVLHPVRNVLRLNLNLVTKL